MIYSTGMPMSHYYNIFYIETRRYTSRDRCNIRKYNNTHTDKRLMQKLVKFCDKLKVQMVAMEFEEMNPDFVHQSRKQKPGCQRCQHFLGNPTIVPIPRVEE